MARKFSILSILSIAAAICLITLLSTSMCEAAGRNVSFRDLTDRRTVLCWPEGEAFDELVIGARGKLTFLYIDSKLGNALLRTKTSGSEETESEDMPRMLVELSGRFSAKKGYTLFVLYIESYKSWTFDTGKIKVGGYTLEEKDIISGVMQNPRAELPSGETELPGGYSGITSFYVKNDFLKAGSEIEVGYDEYLTLWKVPSKNE